MKENKLLQNVIFERIKINHLPEIIIKNNRIFAKSFQREKDYALTELVMKRKPKNETEYEKKLYAFDSLESLSDKNEGDLVAKMSYKKVADVLVKHFIDGLGNEFMFTYDDKTGYFSKDLKDVLSYTDEYARKDLTQQQFYSELLLRIKKRLITGYLSTNVEDATGEYYFRHANKKDLMENFKLGTYEVSTFVNSLEEASFIPEIYHNSILAELNKGIYATEMTVEELLDLKQRSEKLLMNGITPNKDVFTNLKLQKRVYKKMREEQVATVFNFRNLSMMSISELVQNQR